MPPTATLDDIKAYQSKIEKNQISPDVLPACPRCKVSSSFFKIHAFRERPYRAPTLGGYPTQGVALG
jgi:hypothetical protein